MKTSIIERLIEAIGVCLVISMVVFFLLFSQYRPCLMLLPPDVEVSDIGMLGKQRGLDLPVLG
jgi:hypothetical protein